MGASSVQYNKIGQSLNALSDTLSCVNAELGLPLFLTIITVAQYPGLSVNELAEKINVPQQTASRYVATLQGRYQMLGNDMINFVQSPYLSLEVSSHDPRRRALFLTPDGETKINQLLDMLYKGDK